jgi:glutamyl-tRNA synthetase
MAPRMHRLGDFMTHCDFLFTSEVTVDETIVPPKNRSADETRDIMQQFIWELETLVDFKAAGIEAAFKKLSEMNAWSLREITHAARAAIAGKTVSPPLYEVMEILDSDVCRQRLTATVDLLGSLGKKKQAKLQRAYQRASAEWEAKQATASGVEEGD